MSHRTARLFALALLLAAPAAAEEVLVDGIAAQVGTDIVLYSEVLAMTGPSERQILAAGGTEADLMRLRAEGLEALIEARLVSKVVTDLELFVQDAEIDETIANIAAGNGLTLEQLKRSVAEQGMAYEDYRRELKERLERRNVVSALVSSKVRVEEAEVEALYRERFAEQPQSGTQVHLRQLLVPAGEEVGRSLEQACEMATNLRERIARGESFEELASQYSAAAPERGGDIGWLHEDKLAGWMRKLIEPLQGGQVSELARLPFGCTVVMLVERKTYEPVSYEQAKQALHDELYDEKVNDAYRKWMEDLRAKTFIERRGYFAEAARFGQSPFGRPADEAEEPAIP
jgi:peptidyl-prolyl cis-trans isomerase SurA